MNITSKKILAGLALVLLSMAPAASGAVELKLLAPIAMEPVLRLLLPEYEYLMLQKVSVTYATAGAIAERMAKGDAADVAITTAPLARGLFKEGGLKSYVPIAKVGVGVFVRKGAARPDISSVEALRQSVAKARAIGFVDPALGAPTGVHMTQVLKQLNLDLGGRVKLFKVEDRFQGVLRGEAEFGFNQISEILAEPGVELVGPLPAALQNYTSFVAGIVTRSSQPDAARALIDFISPDGAEAMFWTRGFE